MEERDLARATVGRRLSTVTGFCRSAVVGGLLGPLGLQCSSAGPRSARSPPPSDSTAWRWERSSPARRRASPTDHALACLLGLLGLRVSEACSIDIDDLGVERGHRIVTVLGKGAKLAVIPSPPRIARALDLAAGERRSGPLLLARSGRRLNRHAATRIVRRLAKAAGITRHISPHSLRHSFITACLDAGVPLRDVQIAARHADPRTTSRYDRARTIWTVTPATS